MIWRRLFLIKFVKSCSVLNIVIKNTQTSLTKYTLVPSGSFLLTFDNMS